MVKQSTLKLSHGRLLLTVLDHRNFFLKSCIWLLEDGSLNFCHQSICKRNLLYYLLITKYKYILEILLTGSILKYPIRLVMSTNCFGTYSSGGFTGESCLFFLVSIISFHPGAHLPHKLLWCCLSIHKIFGSNSTTVEMSSSVTYQVLNNWHIFIIHFKYTIIRYTPQT